MNLFGGSNKPMDCLEAHDAAVVELRKDKPDIKKLERYVAIMAEDAPNEERTWRTIGQIWRTVGQYEKAIAAFTCCGELGNETAPAAIADLRVRMGAV